MTPDDMHIRRMTRDELDTLVEWAAREGWNPGLDDAEVFWNTDPNGFVAAEIDGELVGGGSIVAYDKRYGFMGFFIMRPECRGHGLGDRLWNERKRRLLARLDSDASVGMDGVFNMQDYYARNGFRFICRDLRFEGRGMDLPQPKGVIEASSLPFRAHRCLRSPTFSGAAQQVPAKLDPTPGRPCSRRGGRRSDTRLWGHAALPDRPQDRPSFRCERECGGVSCS